MLECFSVREYQIELESHFRNRSDPASGSEQADARFEDPAADILSINDAGCGQETQRDETGLLPPQALQLAEELLSPKMGFEPLPPAYWGTVANFETRKGSSDDITTAKLPSPLLNLSICCRELPPLSFLQIKYTPSIHKDMNASSPNPPYGSVATPLTNQADEFSPPGEFTQLGVSGDGYCSVWTLVDDRPAFQSSGNWARPCREEAKRDKDFHLSAPLQDVSLSPSNGSINANCPMYPQAAEHFGSYIQSVLRLEIL
ncbi:uncharacterized protein ARMOST_12219 [Armillaria ostoyae]|uniref:Uncharacterized protein n=1 Tax=Armillaria ostoyae TaxID=47428 RepID=A0A284RJA6_ARMOS|nr:uncharacterized protein ARMOST_12219 [Armillaria ostoyae]